MTIILKLIKKDNEITLFKYLSVINLSENVPNTTQLTDLFAICVRL